MAMPAYISQPAPTEPISFGPISFIPGGKGGRYPYCHSLVLEAAGEVWLVDPAADKAYFQRLARTGRVTAVFVSHFHEDHQKYRYLFPEARFYGPAQEEPAFTSMSGILRLMGLTDPRFRHYWEETLVKEFHYRPLMDFRPYFPGQLFNLGEITLEVIPAPGHSPGHSCFYFPNQELLFLADVDLTPFGPWYGDAASDLEDFQETLQSLRELTARTYLTAHEQGMFTPAEFQAGLDYFQQVIVDRDRKILRALTIPQTLADLVDRRLIYPKFKEPAFVYEHMEAQMLKKHLDQLLDQQAISDTPAGYQAL